MSKMERSRLLSFLSKPRYKFEIAEYFNVPLRLANHHLKEVVRCGQVLVSERRVPGTILKSKGKLEKRGGFLYVSRKSPLLVDNVLKLTVQEAEKTSHSNVKANNNVVSIKFLPKAPSLVDEKLSNRRRRALLPIFRVTRLNSKDSPVSKFLQTFISKARLSGRQLRYGSSDAHYLDENRSLSHIEKLHLFKALSDQPMSFLDIRKHFGVSKRIVMGLVKRKLLEEEWGPGGIGVKFRLTKKGMDHLKQLEAAARMETKRYENIFIRLKSKTSS